MAASSSSPSLSPLSLSSIFKPKPPYLVAARNSFSSLHPPILAFSPSITRFYHLKLPDAVSPKTTKSWKLSAINEIFLVSEASAVEDSQEIITTNGEGVSSIVSVLLFIAFIGLSILTVGVIYISVTDFLQKREREKFEKEEAAKKKKSGKKGKVRARARAGPRGFGQKIEDNDEDVDEAD